MVAARFVLKIDSSATDQLAARGASSITAGEYVSTARFLRSQTRDACLAYPSITLRVLSKEITLSVTHAGTVAIVDTVGIPDDETVPPEQAAISLEELIAQI